MNKVFQAKKEAGKFTWLEQDQMAEYIQSLQDGLYGLVIKKQYKERSNRQNAYLWGVCYELIAQETGHSPEEVHEHLKWRFLRKHGGKLETVKSTTDLTTKEFEEYTENIRRWAASELSISIPVPNEVDYQDENDYGNK